MNIAVIGTGYVGLVTGTCLAESGNQVICVEIDEEKLELMRCGTSPIYEPGLEELLKRNLKGKRLRFISKLDEAVAQSHLIFICVGTPPSENGQADLSVVYEVANDIAKAINNYKIVITKSTVPVGTTDRVRDIITEQTDHPFDVASNPEFLKEGDAVNDFLKPDRIVIGTDNDEAAEALKELYAPFVRTENPILAMDIRSSEMTKYVANVMLATKISFMNEMANLSERLGADIDMVRKGIGSDRRIGYSFIFPGVGYGGSCFPKDVKALIQMAKDHDFNANICVSVDLVNERQKEVLFEKISHHFNGDLANRKFSIWGLAFKPNTDDIREAPSLALIEKLLESGARVTVHDPKAHATTHQVFGDQLEYVDDYYEALNDSDGLALVTEWNEFHNPDFGKMKQQMKTPVIFDGRNIYDPVKLREMGFSYYGIGRPHA